MTSPRTCPARSAAARVPCAGEHAVIDGVWKHQSADGSLVWVDQRVPAGPDPIEWTDRHGDVWQEHPSTDSLLMLVRLEDGSTVEKSNWVPRRTIERQWGELVQTAGASITDEDVAEWQVDDEEDGTGEVDPIDRDSEVRYITEMNRQRISNTIGSTVVNVLPDGSTVVDVIDDGVPIKNPEPIMRSEFNTFTPEQKKLVESAAELENISVMVKEAVLDLRNAARTGDVADAYARVYFLRRELGRVVAALGVGVPRTLATIEAEYRELTEG